MYRYLLCVLCIEVSLHGQSYGQLLDGLAEDSSSLEAPHSFIGGPSIVLADESEEPDSGNWYEKLRWWKEAKGLYTVDIRSAMDELEVLNEEFETKKTEILTALDHYSAELPIKRQTAVHVIDDLINDLVKRQEAIAQERTRTQAQKNPEESTELEEHQKMLNELKKDFEDFNTLYQRLKQTFEVVVPKQIQDAHDYNAGALAAYEGIEHTLDDKKAHRLFNEVENGLENIQAISSYLKGPLWSFIDKAWITAEQYMPKITKSITDLEDKGVVVRPLTAQEKAQMAHLEEERKARHAQKEAELKAAKEWAARPWYQKAYRSVGSFFSRVGSGIWYGISQPVSWVASFFSASESEKKGGKKDAEKATDKKPRPGTPSPAMSQPALPTKLPLVVSGALGPSQAVQVPQKGREAVQRPVMLQPKEPVRVVPRTEPRQEKPPVVEPKKQPHRETEDTEPEEPGLEEEDGEEEESEEDVEESEEDEVPELESEEDEATEEPEEEAESKPEPAPQEKKAAEEPTAQNGKNSEPNNSVPEQKPPANGSK